MGRGRRERTNPKTPVRTDLETEISSDGATQADWMRYRPLTRRHPAMILRWLRTSQGHATTLSGMACADQTVVFTAQDTLPILSFFRSEIAGGTVTSLRPLILPRIGLFD